MLIRLLATASVTNTVPHASSIDEGFSLLDVRPPVVRRVTTFEPQPDTPRRARALLRDVGELWELPDDLIETSNLVLSELVTNVVVHAGTRCRVRVEFTGGELRLSVRDHQTDTMPRLQPQHPDAERGRGLLIVSTLSRRWGVTNRSRRKETWAILNL